MQRELAGGDVGLLLAQERLGLGQEVDAPQVEHVQVRSTARSGPSDRAVTLEEARELFNSQDAKAIQIRYGFEEETWCDTLMVQSDTVKIIRTRLTQ